MTSWDLASAAVDSSLLNLNQSSWSLGLLLQALYAILRFRYLSPEVMPSFPDSHLLYPRSHPLTPLLSCLPFFSHPQHLAAARFTLGIRFQVWPDQPWPCLSRFLFLLILLVFPFSFCPPITRPPPASLLNFLPSPFRRWALQSVLSLPPVLSVSLEGPWLAPLVSRRCFASSEVFGSAALLVQIAISRTQSWSAAMLLPSLYPFLQWCLRVASFTASKYFRAQSTCLQLLI